MKTGKKSQSIKEKFNRDKWLEMIHLDIQKNERKIESLSKENERLKQALEDSKDY